MTPGEPEDLGRLTLTVEGDPPTVYSLILHRLAATRKGESYLLDVAGSQGSVKGVRAALGAQVRAKFSVEDVPCANDNIPGDIRLAQQFIPIEGMRYTARIHPLGMGWIHALFVADTTDFLIVGDDETLWRSLKSATYTTPLLRSWVPYLATRLREEELLVPLWCHRCRCGLLTANSGQLDALVEAGVKDHKLPFREAIGA